MGLRLDPVVMAPLRRVDPEVARGIALRALRYGFGRPFYEKFPDDPALGVEMFGRRFTNPIGLAAGFDKDAVAAGPLMRMGFGFVEVGSITPRAQKGNPRPRIFRLKEDRAVINRMGMNGEGVGPVGERLARLAARGPRRGVLGASIAINKEGADPERDYAVLVRRLAPFVDYIAINVSSPNTPGLRDLQAGARLAKILGPCVAWAPKHLPLLVKIAPDLGADALAAVIEATVEAGAAGLIVGNTTTDRPAGLASRLAREGGGLSGAPLFDKATRVLAHAYRLSGGRLPLIGCGGVSNGREALAKIRAGASLVELFTAFAYDGPGLIPRLKAELLEALGAQGFAAVTEAIGVDSERIAAGLAAAA